LRPWISQSQGAAVLQKTAVVAACPVDDEPSPFGVLEARAAGCRVVGFTHPAIDVVAGQDALLVPRGDHRALTEALSVAVSQDSTELRSHIQRDVEAAYPLARTASFYEGLLHQACR
jgi:glycosyltransferase involved in cell wall biosynthesis